MNDQNMRDEFEPVSAMLQMPQQAPPVDRTAAMSAGADNGSPGIEASGILDTIMGLLR